MTKQVSQFLEARAGIEEAFKELKDSGMVTRLLIKHSVERDGSIQSRLVIHTTAYRENPHPDDINPRLTKIAEIATKCVERFELDGADLEPDPTVENFTTI